MSLPREWNSCFVRNSACVFLLPKAYRGLLMNLMYGPVCVFLVSKLPSVADLNHRHHHVISNSSICTILQVPYKPPPKEQTRPVEFRLLSEIRAHERAEFDNYVCC